ncbi:MAG TPA: GerMN domain-containing protein [Lapillicoccus sp.]|nr:GerMN domain-containing protein [Lapillicoccus sp.]
MSSSCRSPRAEKRRVRRARVVVVASVLVVLGLGSGCTLGPQDAPIAVPGRSPVPPSTSGPPTAVPLTMQAYLLRGDLLARVERQVPEGSGIGPALAALAMPLSRDEVAQGLRTALPPTTGSLAGRLNAAGVALVDVPQGFDRLSLRDQEAALGQIVFTVTADTVATGVQLVQGGRVMPMPDASGQLRSRPLNRVDFAALAPAS